MEKQVPTPSRPIDIGVLTQFLNSLGSYSQDLVQHLESGKKLCHYTSLEGAISIVNSGDLWLTNSRFSNDDEEMNYGYQVVDDILKKMMQSAVANSAKVEWLTRLSTEIASVRDDQVYVCCFCERDNLLSQWRGYADNGGGVAIEFDPSSFTSVTGSDSPPYGVMRLWKVFYNGDLQKKIVTDCIDHPAWPTSDETQQIRFIVDALRFFIPTFKNPGFMEERERRLIFAPDSQAAPKFNFRARRGLLVPFFKLRELSDPARPNFPLPIKSVMIGPSEHRALNAKSFRLLLAANGYSNVEVFESTTPYRR
jgi:hypothetical protein